MGEIHMSVVSLSHPKAVNLRRLGQYENSKLRGTE